MAFYIYKERHGEKSDAVKEEGTVMITSFVGRSAAPELGYGLCRTVLVPT